LIAATTLTASLSVSPSVRADGRSEDATALYEEGRKALENGEFAIASDRFQAAYDALPQEELERRAAVLFELVEARISAFTEDGRPSHLCEATETLQGFLEDNTELRGSRRSRDARKAADLLERYTDELDLIRSDNPDFQCEGAPAPPSTTEDVPELEPGAEPEPRPHTPRQPTQLVRLNDPLVGSGVAAISLGALLLGAATAGLGLGKHVESEGEWLLESSPELSSDAPEVERLNRVGKQANLLAIVGGATGVIALSAGIALFIVGKRRQATQTPTVALTPSFSPRSLGAGLHVRF